MLELGVLGSGIVAETLKAFQILIRAPSREANVKL
jgi:hypothetical protein